MSEIIGRIPRGVRYGVAAAVLVGVGVGAVEFAAHQRNQPQIRNAKTYEPDMLDTPSGKVAENIVTYGIFPQGFPNWGYDNLSMLDSFIPRLPATFTSPPAPGIVSLVGPGGANLELYYSSATDLKDQTRIAKADFINRQTLFKTEFDATYPQESFATLARKLALRAIPKSETTYGGETSPFYTRLDKTLGINWQSARTDMIDKIRQMLVNDRISEQQRAVFERMYSSLNPDAQDGKLPTPDSFFADTAGNYTYGKKEFGGIYGKVFGNNRANRYYDFMKTHFFQGKEYTPLPKFVSTQPAGRSLRLYPQHDIFRPASHAA